MSLSAFFFWMSQISRGSTERVSVDVLPEGSLLTCGIFIEKIDTEDEQAFLCANSQIGFFYRSQVFADEVIGMAEQKEFDAVFEYLADKIDECETLAGKLNALQRGVQEQ